jgi:formylglycine-generating enzyme required for sulfatase activity/tRNA A-37 threonylcarbamoyl transferase component Bud32
MSASSDGYCPICGKSYGPEADRCPVHNFLFQGRDALRPGVVIDGKFEILQRLGAGGMGETYLVRHAYLGENLVLKRVRPDLAEDPIYQQSFLREARSLAALRKLPAVVEIRDAWQTSEGYLALLLEYVEGGNLLQWLDAARGGGPLEPLEAVAIAADLAQALAAAHALGVLHRDVKPQNILMRNLEGGGFQLKLCDFGLAVQRVEEMTRQGTTTTRLGTPGYAAPEQYTLSTREQDARVDVFGLGMTLYRLVAGRLPWETSAASWPLVCTEQRRKSLKELRPQLELESWLENLLLRMTAVERKDRIATAAEALELMQEALAETRPAPGVVATPQTPPKPSANPSIPPPVELRPNRPSMRGAALAASGFAVIALVVWWSVRQKSEDVRHNPPTQAEAVIQPATIAAGTKKVNPKDGLTYVWIPPGRFMMGCSPGDAECFDDEMPTHRVTITKGFWVGQTPVTQQAYQRVTGQNPSHFKGASLPVETVNWNEAKSYCEAIGGRLPTEAEWEYAARAGSTAARYGNLDEIAWYSENSGNQTHEVGQKRANAFGLYDMLGNVWQWVADWYGNYKSGAQSDPSGAGSGQDRALRGGSSGSYARVARVSYRVRGDPGFRYDYYGLRCVGESPSPVSAAPVTSPATIAFDPDEFMKGRMLAAPVTPPATIAAGTRKVNPKDGLTYVWIPPGRFMMGCSPGDTECFPAEKPTHPVTITKGFWLGQTPVTQQAYQRVTGQNPSHFKGANLPVETVGWNEAKAYCAAIGGRLPTEAEWEYAARAGSTGARYGNLDDIAWYSKNSGSQTHEVGQELANAFGLYDMLGNVSQWVADSYGNYPSGAQSDPSGAESGQHRALRGGSWGLNARVTRVSLRVGVVPGDRDAGIGLRCVGE